MDFLLSSLNISLAEWPVAKMVLLANTLSLFCNITPLIQLSSIIKSITLVSKCILPPLDKIVSLILEIILGNLFVPMCG